MVNGAVNVLYIIDTFTLTALERLVVKLLQQPVNSVKDLQHQPNTPGDYSHRNEC